MRGARRAGDGMLRHQVRNLERGEAGGDVAPLFDAVNELENRATIALQESPPQDKSKMALGLIPWTGVSDGDTDDADTFLTACFPSDATKPLSEDMSLAEVRLIRLKALFSKVSSSVPESGRRGGATQPALSCVVEPSSPGDTHLHTEDNVQIHLATCKRKEGPLCSAHDRLLKHVGDAACAWLVAWLRKFA